MSGKVKIGILSDTHGFMDDLLYKHFSDCDELWHAGDIGHEKIIHELSGFKPLKAVSGNIDDRSVKEHVPEENWFKVNDLLVYIIHIAGKPPKYNRQVLAAIKEKQPDILVCGHSHILKVMPDKINNLLFINPGAVGQQGFHKIRTALKMTVDKNKVSEMSVIELGRRGR